MKLSAVQKFTLLDFPGRVACIAFTPGCDLRCQFCHNPEFVLPERICQLAASFIPEAHFFSFLASRQGLLDGVVVTGGEPTIWQDLPDFLAQVKALGFAVKLDTNGNNPAMLKTCVAAGLVDYIAMDVKTSLTGYQSLTGSRANEKRLRESIEFLKVGQVDYEFRTTLIREIHTGERIEEMRALLIGAKRLYLQTFRSGITLDSSFASFHSFSVSEMDIIADQFRTPLLEVSIRM